MGETFEPVDVRRAAMDLLARREHAKGELATKLAGRFKGAPELIESVINQLESEGLQSDTRLAGAYIRSRSGRGHGPIKIRLELRNRGVTDDIISLAFEECALDWSVKVQEVCVKRFGPAAPANAKERARRSRFLQQRGFSFEQISDTMGGP
ncbi:MAG: regulatory protein RecX [Pseudomonadales bacterium]